MTARQLCLQGLIKLDRDGAYSNLTLDSLLEQHRLAGRERAFATALFYGVAARKLTLDFLMAQWCRAKLSPTVRNILRMGLYELAYMGGTKDYAAVNECVNLARQNGQAKAAGLVNAVLRRFTREGMPNLPDLSARYSCTPWIVESLSRDYGRDAAEALLFDALDPAPVTARVNTTRVTREQLIAKLQTEEVTAKPHDLADFITIQGGQLRRLQAYREGLFHVQDAASGLCTEEVAECVSDIPAPLIYDVCAAPGGKAFTMAQLNPNGRVMAFDLHPHRVRLMTDGAARLGLTNVTAAVRDAAIPETEMAEMADAVLCDVPCSGLGVMRRKPEVKYKAAKDVEALPALQYAILSASAGLVKPGGALVYATCTLRRAENEEVVARFLTEYAGFSITRMDTLLPPNQWHSDGFFTAVMRRTSP